MSAGRGLGKVKYMSQPKLSVRSVYRGMKGKRDKGGRQEGLGDGRIHVTDQARCMLCLQG